jgi:multiple antibiotic resistance protein
MDTSKILHDFLVLFATVDPVGSVLIVSGLAAGQDARQRRRLAWRSTWIAGVVMIAFMALGQVILSAMHVSLPAFQLAGGIFLFLFGAQMTFGDVSHFASAKAEAGHDPAVFPLAIPAIATPGAIMAVIVLTDNARFSVASQLFTAGALAAVLVLTWLGMRFASLLQGLLGRNGGEAVIRLLGMILAALAVEMSVQAIQTLFAVPLH